MPHTSLCHHCGTSISYPPSAQRKYCSRACKHDAQRLDPAFLKEQTSLKAKAKYLENREKMLARQLQYRTAHPERFRAVQNKYKNANRERILARARELRAANQEKVKKLRKAWNKAHPDALVNQSAKYRARKRKSPRNDLTRVQWQAIQAAQNHCCAYCKKRCKGRLTQDHITPLSKGGSHTLHNVIAACKS